MKVYQYGLRRPIVNADRVRACIFAGHKFYNDLTASNRQTRSNLRDLEIRSGLTPALSAMEQCKAKELDAASAIAKYRSTTRSREVPPEMKKSLLEAKKATKLARARLGELRKRLRENAEVLAKKAEIQLQGNTASREVRAKSPLAEGGDLSGGWGTLALVSDAVLDASKDTPLFQDGHPKDPRFHSWRGDGSIGVQVHQKGASKQGLTVAEFTSPNDWAYISEGDRPNRKLLHLRVGSSPNGTPIMATWPMVMHRPLPPDAVIRRIGVYRRHVGPKDEWTVSITVKATDQSEPPKGGHVAVDLGWHMTAAGIRVAYTLDDQGRSEELIFEPRRFKEAERLQGIRTDNFNAAREALANYLNTAEHSWLHEECETLPSWRSPVRLAKVVRKWRTQRVPGDTAAYEAAEAWRYHDYHMWAWETGLRKKAERYTKDMYRVFARRLADLYEFASVPDTDFARLRVSDDEQWVTDIRQWSAVGTLREYIMAAFRDRVTKRSAIPKCPACGAETFGRQTIFCSKCPTEEDRDYAVAIGMLNDAGIDTQEIVHNRKRFQESMRSAAE